MCGEKKGKCWCEDESFVARRRGDVAVKRILDLVALEDEGM